jgi:hypothetical protein
MFVGWSLLDPDENGLLNFLSGILPGEIVHEINSSYQLSEVVKKMTYVVVNRLDGHPLGHLMDFFTSGDPKVRHSAALGFMINHFGVANRAPCGCCEAARQSTYFVNPSQPPGPSNQVPIGFPFAECKSLIINNKEFRSGACGSCVFLVSTHQTSTCKHRPNLPCRIKNETASTMQITHCDPSQATSVARPAISSSTLQRPSTPNLECTIAPASSLPRFRKPPRRARKVTRAPM